MDGGSEEGDCCRTRRPNLGREGLEKGSFPFLSHYVKKEGKKGGKKGPFRASISASVCGGGQGNVAPHFIATVEVSAQLVRMVVLCVRGACVCGARPQAGRAGFPRNLFWLSFLVRQGMKWRERGRGRKGVSDCGDMNKTVRPASKETRKREEGSSGDGGRERGRVQV